ncbi:MAG: LysM peptidoglycan-binding domain-containing protein [Actinomycetota bacterium]|nr:LysM peptidoglycan-binding domain-containing protein [Actinomycetota bacterium]
MEKRTSAFTRIFAALALIGAVLAVVVAVSVGMDGDSSSRGDRKDQQTQKEKKRPRTKAKTYTVQTGDTLTSIAHKTGVPVNEILALNPEVDPQILIAGQTLKLK